jgi:hypothetical protein
VSRNSKVGVFVSKGVVALSVTDAQGQNQEPTRFIAAIVTIFQLF